MSLCGKHAYKVEAAGLLPCIVFGNPGLGGPKQTFFFDDAQRFVRLRHAVLCSCLHFHEDKFPVIFGHDVEFQVTAAPVSGQNTPAHVPEHGGGRRLTFRTRAGRRRVGVLGWIRLFEERAQHSQPCSCTLGGSTPRKSSRCSGQGPYFFSASLCSFVP